MGEGLGVLLAITAVVAPLALAWLLIGHGLRRRGAPGPRPPVARAARRRRPCDL